MKWLDKNEYPFEQKYLILDGVRMHYIDEGEGEILLFVHGTPSWSFDFRNVIKVLSKKYRCIAMDHIGFGLSDKPRDYPYNLKRHADNLSRLIDHLMLKKFSMVVHDFGGPIGFSFASENPNRVRKLIVLNSWLWSNESDESFQRLRKVLKNPVIPFLYLNFNFSPRFLLPNSFGASKVTKKILKHYTSPFSKRSERYGTVGFLNSLLNDHDYFELLWNKKVSIKMKPMLLIWGIADKLLTEKYLEKFIHGFDRVIVRKIQSAGHFPQEECPEQVADYIDEFCQSNKTSRR